METDKLVFCRNFSALGPFQSEGRLWYELSGVLGAEQEFCVRLRREVACGHCGMQAHICTGRQLARQFLRFLYENAIEPEQLPALLHEDFYRPARRKAVWARNGGREISHPSGR